MREYGLIITETAERDLQDIWLYILEYSEATADKTIDTIYLRCERLKQLPQLGRAMDELRPGIRRLVEGDYSIFYRLNNDMVEIIRVIRNERDFRRLLK